MNINFYKHLFKDREDIDPQIFKEFMAKQLILRDYLAIERTTLTNEATFLAYVRTGLTVSVVGITLFQLSGNYTPFEYLGVFMTLVGFYTLALGSARTIQMRNKINKFLRKREEIQKPEL